MKGQIREWGDTNAPCRGCKDRHASCVNGVVRNCHTDCERYAAFRAKANAKRDAIYRDKRARDAADAVTWAKKP